MPARIVAVVLLCATALALTGCLGSRDVRLLGEVARASTLREVVPRAPARPEAAEPAPPPAAMVEDPVVPTVMALPTDTVEPTATLPPTATPDPFAGAGSPVQLEIPAIGVVSLVEQVGMTADGAMDVPKGWMNVGWYHVGFQPGQPGNAVMAGHLDSRSGGPAIFWDLSRLQPGDEAIVTYENGDRYTFAVQNIEVVPYDVQGEKVATIFGPSQTADLNLITCNGDWDRGKATYTQRLVVYTTLVPEKTVRAGYTATYD